MPAQTDIGLPWPGRSALPRWLYDLRVGPVDDNGLLKPRLVLDHPGVAGREQQEGGAGVKDADKAATTQFMLMLLPTGRLMLGSGVMSTVSSWLGKTRISSSGFRPR
jgi:hypothetical protein